MKTVQDEKNEAIGNLLNNAIFEMQESINYLKRSRLYMNVTEIDIIDGVTLQLEIEIDRLKSVFKKAFLLLAE